MHRQDLIYEIGDLIEANYRGCKKNPYPNKGQVLTKRDNWCRENCEVCKELSELGKQLNS